MMCGVLFAEDSITSLCRDVILRSGYLGFIAVLSTNTTAILGTGKEPIEASLFIRYFILESKWPIQTDSAHFCVLLCPSRS